MKRTISAMRGKGSLSHNRRDFIAENVDSSRTPLNIEYRNEDIRAVYHELFDDALARYNEKQTRKDRIIDDYYEKIRTGKQEKLFEELIIQIGNKDDMNASSENGQLARQMLDEYMQSFQQRNPTLRVFSAHLHMDEATPHLHIDFIPFTTGSKRGLETRVSLKKALEALGFAGGTKSHTELNQWIESEKQVLASIMARHDIEWEQKGTHEEHLSVLDYKKQERSKEVAALENQIDTLQEQTVVAATALSEKQEQLDDIAPILKNTEKFVRKYDDPERLLPEAGMLESGKAFREKKALPILGKLLKYARSLFRENTELKAKVQKLEKENTAFKSANWNHTHEIVRLKMENQELHKAKDKLDALVGRIGNDVLQKLLSETPKEQPKHKEESL
ncbi:MAG: plasmid recombination protein [Christensenellales bacterium]